MAPSRSRDMSLGESNSIAPKASACPGTWGMERSRVTTAAISSPPQKQTWLQPPPPEPNGPGCSCLPMQGNCTGGRCASGDGANPTGTETKVVCNKVPSSGLILFALGGRSRYSCPRSRVVLFSICATDVLSQVRRSSLGPVTVRAGTGGGDSVPPPPGKELGASPPTSKFN